MTTQPNAWSFPWPAIFGLLLGAAGGCASADPGEGSQEDSDGDDPVGGKADGLGSQVARDPGQLRWDQLAAPTGVAEGLPLFVSNNPEHVESYGVLAGVAYPGLALTGAQRKPGAPEAQWSRGIVDPSCPDGGMREFGIYLAHILPSSLGQGRRLTVAVVPRADTRVTVRGELGTTDWSSNGVTLTTSSGWLSAQVAKSFFFGADNSRTLDGKAGQLLVLDTELAKSLVEGRLHVQADACLHPFTIAHSAGLGSVVPGHYAKGDVKWPGWSNGTGFGRAAGIYAGEVVRGQNAVTIGEVPSVQGVGLLTAGDAVRALARHGDSAEILFGNYGVMLDQTLQVENASDACVDAKIEFVSYMDRNSTPGRTPTEQFFRDTEGAYTPSMFWNGPISTVTSASGRVTQAILNHAPTAAEQGDPHRALGSMRHTLAEIRLDAGGSETIAVRFPVPGYIVAPVALTVHAEPCED
jgi:hypothetical protein